MKQDTICAISTPPGVGGIAVVRVSGDDAITIADTIWQGRPLAKAESHTAHLGMIVDPANGAALDQAVATVYRAPRSFTSDNVVELAVHGSQYVQQELIRLLVRQGCRIAEPGEFTRRAFIAGRLDLAEAEAVADLIGATSRAAHTIALSQMQGSLSKRLADLRASLIDLGALLELELDFSEEDVTFASRAQLTEKTDQVISLLRRLQSTYTTAATLRDGIPVAIIGAPNVGKSTLLNTLLDRERAIVSDIPGTTRDTVEDSLDINGVTFRVIDTAGMRETTDTVEAIGIQRARDNAAAAMVVLLLVDATAPELPPFTHRPEATVIQVITKTDLAAPARAEALIANTLAAAQPPIAIAAPSMTGIDNLTERLAAIAADLSPARGEAMLTRARHHQAVGAALDSMTHVADGLAAGLTGDLIAQDLRTALHHLGEIAGTIAAPDLLATIFSRFCIGK